MKSLGFFFLAAAGLALAGCGDAGQPKSNEKPVKVGVFSSARECHEVGKLSDDLCAKAIEQAGREHDKKTTLHAAIEACEAAEGANNCERAGGNHYRPKLQAYAVILEGAPMAAHSLYASNIQGVAFRSLAGDRFTTSDPNIVFSETALELAAALGDSRHDENSADLAKAAANIH